MPKLSANEASMVEGVKVFPVGNLAQLIRHLKGEKLIEALKPVDRQRLIEEAEVDFDFSEVAGQEQAKRALEIAAHGRTQYFNGGAAGVGQNHVGQGAAGGFCRN